MQDQLDINPNKKWEFDSQVTDCFDDMIARSIPNYESMRELTYKLGRYFIMPKTTVLDIGCSRGLSVDRFIKEYPNSSFYLYDISEPMVNVCKEKYQLLNNVYVYNDNVEKTKRLPDNISLALSVLTLQFIPKEERQKICNTIYNNLNDNGAFVLVEKLDCGYLDDIFVREYYDIKQKNGYTPKQIKDKRKSLKGALEPYTEKENMYMLKEAGFKHIQCFYRCLNFAGYIAVK